MNILSFLSVSAPKSLWVTLISWVQSAIGNLGWTIILVTLFIKLVTTPLDFWVKLNTKKQTLIQQKCAPQVAKLKKKFGNDRISLNAQSQALYKREGLNMRSGCIVMMINTILSLVIFITFYSDLRKYSAYEAITQYEEIETTYTQSYKQAFVDYKSDDEFTKVEDVDNWFNTYNSMTDEALKQAEYDSKKSYIEHATDIASKAAVKCWNENKSRSSWLWIQNIWVADSTEAVFPSYANLVSIAQSTDYADHVSKIDSTSYDKIATLISKNAPRQNNGYFLLPIIAGLITFLSQYISELHNKLKNKKANAVAKTASTEMGSTMKVMKIVMPIIMIMFTLTASASFGLYIVASNIATIALGELTSLIINVLTRKTRYEVEEALEKEANRLIRKGKLKG